MGESDRGWAALQVDPSQIGVLRIQLSILQVVT